MRLALVPGVPALLPEYAGLEDPVAELRAACLAAVAWLAEAGPVEVLAGGGQGVRVAEALLDAAGVSRLERQSALAPRPPVGGAPRPPEDGPAALLVVGNGSARRTEKAPGHLDDRAAAFDAELGRALAQADRGALAGIDPDLARELWADTGALVQLAARLPDGARAQVDHDADPFGVQYWVIRWEAPTGLA